MKNTTTLLSILLLMSLNTHTMQKEPHQRKPQPVNMETIEQLQNINTLVEYENTASSIDRTIGCCIVLSVPCLILSVWTWQKIKPMMNW